MTLAANNPPQADGSKDGALAPWRLRFMRSMAARANPDRARALLVEFDARLGTTLAMGLSPGVAVAARASCGVAASFDPAVVGDPAPC